jgi:hypothetical protein
MVCNYKVSSVTMMHTQCGALFVLLSNNGYLVVYLRDWQPQHSDPTDTAVACCKLSSAGRKLHPVPHCTHQRINTDAE